MPKIQCPINHAAQKFPHYPAIIEGNQKLTYAQLDALINQASDNLKLSGIKAADRIAILNHNSLEYVVILWALWRLKAISVNINIRNPSSTILNQLKNTNCKTILLTKKLRTHLLKIHQITFNSIFEKKKRTQKNKKYYFDLNQNLTILFTSGTTSEPKAALHTFSNHYHSALGSNKHIAANSSSRWLLNLPLYHVGALGILFRVFLTGACVVIATRKENIPINISHVSLVPTQLLRLISQPKNIKTLQKLDCILLGGSSMPAGMLTQCKRFKLPVYISYGLTEMTSQVATSGKLNFNNVKILKYRQLKITKSGEILVKGKTLFKGYILRNNLIRTTDKSGWFHTGDLGRLTKDKQLFITGRKDNMFISGGENIQPEEIENYLLKISKIEAAIVVACKDSQFGLRPVAFIKSKANQKISTAQLEKSLAKYLPKYKLPIKFYPWPKQKETSIKPSRIEFQKLANA